MAANTAVVTAADGTVREFPCDLLLERKAVLMERVGGEAIGDVMGGANQLWIPGLPAKYYVRDVVSIRLEKREQPPRLDPEGFVDDGNQYLNRPNVSVGAYYSCRAGQTAVFEGTASDYDRAVVGLQLSFDEGTTWTEFPLEGTVAERLVSWQFAYTPDAPGTYRLKVRAVNERGEVSPIAADSVLEVV